MILLRLTMRLNVHINKQTKHTTKTATSTTTVSKLVFYAQSTSAFISGQTTTTPRTKPSLLRTGKESGRVAMFDIAQLSSTSRTMNIKVGIAVSSYLLVEPLSGAAITKASRQHLDRFQTPE